MGKKKHKFKAVPAQAETQKNNAEEQMGEADDSTGQQMDDPQSKMMMDPQDTPTPRTDTMGG